MKASRAESMDFQVKYIVHYATHTVSDRSLHLSIGNAIELVISTCLNIFNGLHRKSFIRQNSYKFPKKI